MRFDSRIRASPSADVNSVISRPQPDWALVTVESMAAALSTLRSCGEAATAPPQVASASPQAVNRLAWRMKRRKTVSVTPAIGASTVAGATSTVPIRTSAGTRVSAGIACSMGLSQSFFTVNPLPAMNFT